MFQEIILDVQVVFCCDMGLDVYYVTQSHKFRITFGLSDHDRCQYANLNHIRRDMCTTQILLEYAKEYGMSVQRCQDFCAVTTCTWTDAIDNAQVEALEQ